MARILMAAYTNYRRDPRVKREAETLADRGHEVTFLARRQPGGPREETINGVRILNARGVPNDRTSIAMYVADYLCFFAAIVAHLLLRPLKYELIHVSNMPDFLVFATWPARLLGTPVIHDVHDLMPEIYEEKFGIGRRRWMIWLIKCQERWAGRFASAVLTVEDRLKDILAARGIDARKIRVLMNLPDDRIFSPRPEPPPAASGERPFVMVYHGTLANRLGLDIALRAVAAALPEAPRLRLRIIGAGEERERLIMLRNELGLQEQVHFSDGFVPVEAIPQMIHDADVGVVPLRISGGTDIMLPTKLLEYVTIGIPCIVPRTVTIGRYFDDTMVRFFEAESVASLADAILALYRDPQACRQLAAEARRRFASTYCWSRHQAVYVDLVEQLLARRGTAAQARGLHG